MAVVEAECDVLAELKVFMDKCVRKVGEGVDVRHHACRPMDHSKVVTKQFRSLAVDDVGGTRVVKDLLHVDVISDPGKEGTQRSYLFVD
jgi:hypothetical protein